MLKLIFSLICLGKKIADYCNLFESAFNSFAIKKGMWDITNIKLKLGTVNTNLPPCPDMYIDAKAD